MNTIELVKLTTNKSVNLIHDFMREEYPEVVEIEMVYSGILGFGHKKNAIKPPNIAVDETILSGEATFEDIDKKVIEKLSSQIQGPNLNRNNRI